MNELFHRDRVVPALPVDDPVAVKELVQPPQIEFGIGPGRAETQFARTETESFRLAGLLLCRSRPRPARRPRHGRKHVGRVPPPNDRPCRGSSGFRPRRIPTRARRSGPRRNASVGQARTDEFFHRRNSSVARTDFRGSFRACVLVFSLRRHWIIRPLLLLSRLASSLILDPDSLLQFRTQHVVLRERSIDFVQHLLGQQIRRRPSFIGTYYI